MVFAVVVGRLVVQAAYLPVVVVVRVDAEPLVLLTVAEVLVALHLLPALSVGLPVDEELPDAELRLALRLAIRCHLPRADAVVVWLWPDCLPRQMPVSQVQRVWFVEPQDLTRELPRSRLSVEPPASASARWQWRRVLKNQGPVPGHPRVPETSRRDYSLPRPKTSAFCPSLELSGVYSVAA